MIKKLLVGFDGSEHADRALDFALDLAQKYDAEIQLMTVVPPLFMPVPSFVDVMRSDAIAEATVQLEKSFKAALSKAEEKVKKETPSVRVSTQFEFGNPEERICEKAKKGGFDLIVIGSRGLGRRDYPLGSVSSRVVDCSECPILIVK